MQRDIVRGREGVRRFRRDYAAWGFYSAVFFLAFFLDRAIPLCPLSVGLCFALCFAGFSPFVLGAISCASLFLSLGPSAAALASVGSMGIALVFAVYRRRGAALGAEGVLFLCFFLLPYIAFGGEEGQEILRSVRAAVTVIFGLTQKNLYPLLLKKRVLFRPSAYALLSAAVLTVFAAVGVQRAVGGAYLTALSAVVLLYGTHLLGAAGGLFSGVLILPRLFLTGSFAPVGAFFLGAACLCALRRKGRLISALLLPAYYLVLTYGVGAFSFSVAEMGGVCAGTALYLFAPHKLLSYLEKQISAREERTLVRAAVNRQRQTAAASISALSSVFREIEGVFSSPKKVPSEGEICRAITQEAMQSVCVSCSGHAACVGAGRIREEDIQKTVAVGLMKGRVTVLDLSGEVSRACAYSSNLLFCINQLLSRAFDRAQERENAEVGKRLLAAEAGSLAGVLEKLAGEYAVPVAFDRKTERAVYEALAERGVFAEEILAQKNGGISLLLSEGDAERVAGLSGVLSRAAGVRLTLCEQIETEAHKKTVLFRPAPRLSAALGLSTAKKEGSRRSGDTHSMLKVGADGLFVAISDGMGSGEAAGEISSSAIGLIESFYRAGFSSEALLSAVNRLLSTRAEESFAALDIATLSLSSGRCDFIKIGAPYGFVLKKEGISVVQGNSLPLGILEEISPEVTTGTLSSGDTLLMASDGVTDAFGSATDFLEFLAKERERNPQKLADGVLARAKALSGGECKDDMTVLCVRLYEKTAG